MVFKQNDSLEVDAILERIKNKLSERHFNNINNSIGDTSLNSGHELQNSYISPTIKRPLLLDDKETDVVNIQDPNIIPNPFNNFVEVKNKYSNNIDTTDIIELTPNMEIHPNALNQIDDSVIEINLNKSEYKLLVEVLSKRFSKAFYITKLQPKIEKWLDINLKDLLASK